MYKRIYSIFFVILIIFFSFGNIGFLAEEIAPEVKFIAPKLPKNVEPYNPETPENLKPEQLYAKSAIVIEQETGKVIFEKNADDRMYPASTTKILTALLGLEFGNYEETVYVSESAQYLDKDSSLIPLAVGESIKFIDLIYATMLRSGNEGAELIAQTVSGSEAEFVNKMNQTALNLGCTSTHFENSTGLHNDNHYTTARDMAKIAAHAMKNAEFRKVVAATKYTLPKSNLSKRRNLKSRIFDFLVSFENNQVYYPYATGIKTGFTNSAGHCFVGSAESLGVKLISVVFYSSANGRWSDTKKLMEYGFSQISSETPISLYNSNPIVLETSGFSTHDENLGKLKLDLVQTGGDSSISIITTQKEKSEVALNMMNTSLIEYVRDFRAPIQKGEVLGNFTYIDQRTGQRATYNLLASRDIAPREDAPKSLSQIENEVFNDSNFFPKLNLELFILWLIPPLVIFAIVSLLSILVKNIKFKRRAKKMNDYSRKKWFR